MEQIKTFIFLIILTLIFIFIGFAFGGTSGMLIAFLIALGMNFYAYYFSDKQVLKHYNAIPLEDEKHPVFRITKNLVQKANLPMPKEPP